MSPFSTHHLIWVNYKLLSQLFPLIYRAFPYLNSVRHFQALNCVVGNFLLFCSTVLEKINLKSYRHDSFAYFNNAHFHIYFSLELTILWLNKITFLSYYGFTKNNNINIQHNIYYSYISEFLLCYNIVYLIILPFYMNCSTIRHGQIHWKNLQKQSISTLNLVTQVTR